jgi:hypothetical protein
MQQQHMQQQQAENLLIKNEKDKTLFGFSVLLRNVLILIFLIFYILPKLESGIGTGFPIITLSSLLQVGCQRISEPVSHLFCINMKHLM